MRAAAIAILSLLVVSPVQAGQLHRQIVSSIPSCDNDGRCTTFNAGVARIYSDQTKRKITRTASEPANTAITLTVRSDPEVTTEEITVATPVATGAAEMATDVAKGTPQMVKGALDGNGNKAPGIVVSSKTGARARVGIAYAARFQAYINDLEKNYGARVLFCQLGWGRVDQRCNLPDRVTLGRIAAAHGLFEGGRWCHSDYGHAQTSVTAAACGNGPFRIVRQISPEPTADRPRP